MSDATSERDTAIATDLRRAASYRYLSLLFAPPTQEIGDELVSLAGSVAPALAEDAEALGKATGRSLQGLYHKVLGAAGQVPDVECGYDDNTAGGRGPLLADVAGFYRAFSFEAPAGLTTDHICTELGFMGWLAMKEAFARHEGDEDHRAITEEARRRFVKDHLGRWVLAFLERVAQVGEGTHYEVVATLASRTLRSLEGQEALSHPSRRKQLPVIDDPPDVDACGL
jgi:nitrate reductase assembly molybdenum cofactor insertion protein NarJ